MYIVLLRDELAGTIKSSLKGWLAGGNWVAAGKANVWSQKFFSRGNLGKLGIQSLETINCWKDCLKKYVFYIKTEIKFAGLMKSVLKSIMECIK